MTGNDVINQSLLLLRRIYPGQTIATTEQATAQLTFNTMLGEWNAAGMAIYSVAPVTVALTGAPSYIISPRPVKVEAWSARTTSGQATAGVPLDAAEFAGVAVDRSAVGVRIKALNYDAAFPNASVHVYPIASAGTLELWVWSQFALISDFTLSLDSTYPPGYLHAFVYNLAVALSSEFLSRDADLQAIVNEATAAKAALASVNASQHHIAPSAAGPASTAGTTAAEPAA